MNNFKTLVRVAKDPEKFNTKSGKNGIKFLMAIPRPYSKNREKGAQDADFINGVAFSATADFLERNISKGTRLVVDGALRSDRFQKDGQTRYSAPYILIDEVTLVDFKNGQNTHSASAQPDQSASADDWGSSDIPF